MGRRTCFGFTLAAGWLMAGAGGTAYGAGYYVLTFANNSASNSLVAGGVTASYNSPGTGSNFVQTNGVGSYNGVVDPSGLLTSAFDQTSVELAAGPPDVPLPQNGDAYASSNLATGELHAYEDTSGSTAGGQANAGFADTLFFTGNTSNSLLYFSATLDGGQFVGAGANARAEWSLGINGTARLEVSVISGFPNATDINGGSCASQCIETESAGNGWVTYGFGVNAADDIVFNGVFDLGLLSSITLTDELDLSSGGGEGNPNAASPTSNDFGDTSTLRLALSPGVSYTSASEVFLSESAPEPGSMVLSAAALFALAALRIPGREWKARYEKRSFIRSITGPHRGAA